MLSYQIFITFHNLSILTLCSLYQFLSLYQSFVVLSNICHLLAPCYLFTFYVIFSFYKFTYCTHHKHNSLSCSIERTLSALIQFPNSPGVFGHRAILLWGGIEAWLGVFFKNKRYPLVHSSMLSRPNCYNNHHELIQNSIQYRMCV